MERTHWKCYSCTNQVQLVLLCEVITTLFKFNSHPLVFSFGIPGFDYSPFQLFYETPVTPNHVFCKQLQKRERDHVMKTAVALNHPLIEFCLVHMYVYQ